MKANKDKVGVVLAESGEARKAEERRLAAVAEARERFGRLVANADFVEFVYELFVECGAFAPANCSGEWLAGRASITDGIRRAIGKTEGGPKLLGRLTERYWNECNKED